MTTPFVNLPAAPPSARELEIAKLVLARKRLRDFVGQAWHILEPATPFKPNWHIDCLCAHLEAVTNGQLSKLIVNIPPGSAKSLLTCVFWPAWEWIQNPSQRWLYGSYKQDLALRDSLKMRRLIASDWYQQRFGHLYQIRDDQDAKGRYETTKTGLRAATGVLSATGERAGRIVWDDPHNIEERESDNQRQAVIDAWRGTWSERGADPKTSTYVIIMQRLHMGDISGYLLDNGGWEHLCLPTEYEGGHILTGIGWEDPRKEAGELLWPGHVGPDEVEAKKKELGPYNFAGQHQQRPAPKEGGQFKAEWFQVVDAVPAIAHRVRAWDNASTPGGGDYTVGVLMAKTPDNLIWIEDVVRGQWSATDRDRIKRETAIKDHEKYGNVRNVDSQDPGSAGKDAAAASVRNLAGFSIRTEPNTGSKIMRADPLASQAGAGNLRMLKADWNRDVVDEAIVFDHGNHDDIVDALSLCYKYLAPLGALSGNWRHKVNLNYNLGFGGRKKR